MTHTGRLNAQVREGYSRKSDGWKQRHSDAMDSAHPIAMMVWSLAQYADQHQARFGSKLGDDYVLGPAWKEAVEAVLKLLNGDCGDLDCGMVDGALRTMLEREGLESD